MPSKIIKIVEIEEVINNFNNKSAHLLIRLKKLDVHLKSDQDEVKDHFFESLDYVRRKLRTEGKRSESSACIDDEIKLAILAENELSNWGKLKVTDTT